MHEGRLFFSSLFQHWITKEVKDSIYDRIKAKKRAVQSGLESDWKTYRTLRNKLNNKIKYMKASYYQSKIDNSTDSRALWKTINQVLNRKSKDTEITEIEVNKKSITDQKEIANLFNNYFTSIGPSMSVKLAPSQFDFIEFMRPSSSTNVFRFQHVNYDMVYNLLQKMDTSKATGLDGISPTILKLAAPVISKFLTEIFNKSIDTGIFPDSWKVSKVLPLFKKDDKLDMNNYRPISILSAVTKVFEKLLYEQLYQYLEENSILTKHQSGFRSHHSTLTALLDATNEWFTNIDNGNINSVVFLDLAKAFDTVDHDILLHKLKFYGVKNTDLNLIRSYLSNRIQYCSVGNNVSHPGKVKCGIPQGSNLGPLLFIIYINDLPHCLEHSVARMFADDTTITVAENNLKQIEQVINLDLKNLLQWFLANKLSLSAKKTWYMLMASDPKLANICYDPNLLIGDCSIDRVSTTKSLGVYIDERLSWSDHIDHIIKKVSSSIAALRHIKPFVKRETLLTLYNSLIQPQFDYCNVVWDNPTKGLTDRLQRLQNRAARVITGASYEIRSKDILNDLNWETLAQRREKHKAILMYKITNDLTPSYLSDKFTTVEKTKNYNFRNKAFNLNIPHAKTSYLEKSLLCKGPKIWNSIPTEIRQSSSLNSFKQKIKNFKVEY